MTGTSAPREVSFYLADWIRQRHREGRTYADLAAELGVSKTQILNLRDSTRGAGRKLEDKFAERHHHGSIDDLRRAAQAFCQSHGLDAPEIDPYPNRAAAMARLRGLLGAETVRRLLSLKYPADEPSEFEWVTIAVEEERAHQRERLRSEERVESSRPTPSATGAQPVVRRRTS